MTDQGAHERVNALLAAFAVGALEEGETADVEAHIQQCSVCASELRKLQEAVAFLSERLERPPDDVWERILRQIRRRQGNAGDPA